MAEKPAMTRKTFGTASIAAAVTAFARVAEVDASGGATAGVKSGTAGVVRRGRRVGGRTSTGLRPTSSPPKGPPPIQDVTSE